MSRALLAGAAAAIAGCATFEVRRDVVACTRNVDLSPAAYELARQGADVWREFGLELAGAGEPCGCTVAIEYLPVEVNLAGQAELETLTMRLQVGFAELADYFTAIAAHEWGHLYLQAGDHVAPPAAGLMSSPHAAAELTPDDVAYVFDRLERSDFCAW